MMEKVKLEKHHIDRIKADLDIINTKEDIETVVNYRIEEARRSELILFSGVVPSYPFLSARNHRSKFKNAMLRSYNSVDDGSYEILPEGDIKNDTICISCGNNEDGTCRISRLYEEDSPKHLFT